MYQRVLLIVGAVLLLAGVVTWIVAANILAKAQSVAGFSRALGVPSWFDDGGVGGATIWMWVGVGAAILGSVLVLVFVIVRAVAGRSDVAQSRPTLAEVRQQRS